MEELEPDKYRKAAESDEGEVKFDRGSEGEGPEVSPPVEGLGVGVKVGERHFLAVLM